MRTLNDDNIWTQVFSEILPTAENARRKLVHMQNILLFDMPEGKKYVITENNHKRHQ